MKTSTAMNTTISRHDYGPALQGALAWLGDRYLLAEPLNRRGEDRKLPVEESPLARGSQPPDVTDFSIL